MEHHFAQPKAKKAERPYAHALQLDDPARSASAPPNKVRAIYPGRAGSILVAVGCPRYQQQPRKHAVVRLHEGVGGIAHWLRQETRLHWRVAIRPHGFASPRAVGRRYPQATVQWRARKRNLEADCTCGIYAPAAAAAHARRL